MGYFLPKPIQIEARQSHGTKESVEDLVKWINDTDPEYEARLTHTSARIPEIDWTYYVEFTKDDHYEIMSPFDWLVLDSSGFRICPIFTFEETYVEVEKQEA